MNGFFKGPKNLYPKDPNDSNNQKVDSNGFITYNNTKNPSDSANFRDSTTDNTYSQDAKHLTSPAAPMDSDFQDNMSFSFSSKDIKYLTSSTVPAPGKNEIIKASPYYQSMYKSNNTTDYSGDTMNPSFFKEINNPNQTEKYTNSKNNIIDSSLYFNDASNLNNPSDSIGFKDFISSTTNESTSNNSVCFDPNNIDFYNVTEEDMDNIIVDDIITNSTMTNINTINNLNDLNDLKYLNEINDVSDLNNIIDVSDIDDTSDTSYINDTSYMNDTSYKSDANYVNSMNDIIDDLKNTKDDDLNNISDLIANINNDMNIIEDAAFSTESSEISTPVNHTASSINLNSKKQNKKNLKENRILITVIAGVILMSLTALLSFFYSQNKETAEKYIAQGHRHFVDKKYELANTSFLKAIKMEPSNIPARLGLAESYMMMSQYFNAETRLMEILDIDSQNKDGYIYLQNLYDLSEDHNNLRKTLGIMRQIGLDQYIVYGNLTGKVIDGADETDADLSNAQVTLKIDGNSTKTLPTDQDGNYFTFLKQNTFGLTIEKPGYKPYDMQIEIKPNEILCMPTIRLMPATGGSQNTMSGPVEGSLGPRSVSMTSDFVVTYNFAENGGTASTKATDNVTIGKSVDLSPEATKEGWEFVGWNTNKDAETKLYSFSMGPGNVTLYAIYKKTLTATFRDYRGSALVVRDVSTTIYNNAAEGLITLPSQNSYTDSRSKTWTPSGWSSNSTSFAPGFSPNSSIPIRQNTVFYGIYRSQFTLTYSANGSQLPSETKTAYINSANITKTNQYFTLAAPPSGFTGWSLNVAGGKPSYDEGNTVPALQDITATGIR